MEPIRIFVGTSETEDKWIERVLVYTLLENTDRELEITMMRPSMFEDWNKTGWGTPFTCFRYAIPHLCDYKGKAIYMDCDQMSFRDIGEFYDTDLGARWNSFDGYVTDGESPDRETQQQYHIDDIYHLHFTSLSSQIWHPKYSPHGKSSYRRKDIAHILWKYVYKIRQLQDYL